MTADEILIDSARVFMEDLMPQIGDPNGAVTFKDELTEALYSYHENVDQLVFLYEVKKLNNYELKIHNEKCPKPEPTQCLTHKYYHKCIFFIEQEIRALIPSDDFSLLRPSVNISLVRQNLVDLSRYPKAAKLFQDSLDKISDPKYDRNLLDDLRLCLEQLLKEVLANSKSLENQKEALAGYLEERKCSKEISNMIWKLFDLYSKYQNDKVKHSDNYKKEEVDLLINLSSSFIAFMLVK